MEEIKPKIQIFDPVADVAKKFDFYIKVVVCILVVTVLNMVFMVAGLLLDSWHFNSAVYKEYSDKNNAIDSFQKSSQSIIGNNGQNQQIIVDQQKQILELLKKIK